MAYVKTDTLIGPALDWAVAKVQGYDDVQVTDYQDADTPDHPFFSPTKLDEDGREICGGGMPWEPSTNWAQGGAIIDQERYSFATMGTGPFDPATGLEPVVCVGIADFKAGQGPTHLIAAMRCLVRNCLGDEVDVPDALV